MMLHLFSYGHVFDVLEDKLVHGVDVTLSVGETLQLGQAVPGGLQNNILHVLLADTQQKRGAQKKLQTKIDERREGWR